MTYTTEQLAQFPWIVSTDTLRAEDLLPKYWQTAETLAVVTDRPQLINPETLAALALLVGEDSRESDWSDQLAAQTLEDLAETLQDVAPSGFYFGASEGDGACFGFWLSDEWLECLEHCGWASDCDPEILAPIISELILDGIDPDTFQDAYQGEAEGDSEEQAGADFAQQLADELGLPSKIDGSSWPMSCIDWRDAWWELEIGDGFRLHKITGTQWAVFRNV